MNKFQQMQAFVTVAEAGSFVRAAEAMNLSKTAVSRLVGELEARLGVRLIQRTTRRLSLTAEGQGFLERCRELLGSLASIEAEVAAHVEQAIGHLRINVPVSYGSMILAPLWRLRGRGAASRPLLLGVVFFSAVGLAYLMIEVWLLHRFAMYLGHQTYSLGVVLAALLLSTGLGAWLGERLVPAPRRRVLVGVASILALVCVGSLWAPGLLEATWTAPVWVKSLLVVAFTAPLGLAMGLPFPGGLRWIAWRSPPGVPWCVGVNSFASVLAMVSVVPIALGFGYSAVLGCGVALYGVAGLASLLMTGAAEARRA